MPFSHRKNDVRVAGAKKPYEPQHRPLNSFLPRARLFALGACMCFRVTGLAANGFNGFNELSQGSFDSAGLFVCMYFLS